MKVPLDCYGVHEDTEYGFKWLVQEHRQDNLVGVDSQQIQFNVPKKKQCPHNINLPKNGVMELKTDEEASFYETFKDHPIVQSFAPLPVDNNKPLYILTNTMQDELALMYLAAMTSPVFRVVIPVTFVLTATKQLNFILDSSNLTRVLISGIEHTNLKTLELWTKTAFSSRGKVIFSGETFYDFTLRSVMDVVEMDPELTDAVLKLINVEFYQRLGAKILYDYMEPESA